MNKYTNSVIIIGGGKGGVGKSLVSSCVIDLLVQSGKKVVIIDTDDTNSDIYWAYRDEPNIDCLFQPLDKENDASRVGEIIEKYPDEIIVLNAAARSKLVDYVPVFIDVCRENERELLTLWPVDTNKDSMQLALDYFDVCEGTPFFVILNKFFGEQRDFLSFHNHRNEDFRKSTIVAEFPMLSPLAMEVMRSNRLNFSNYDSKKDKNGYLFLSRTNCGLIARFRKNVRKAMQPFTELLDLEYEENR